MIHPVLFHLLMGLPAGFIFGAATMHLYLRHREGRALGRHAAALAEYRERTRSVEY